MYVPRERTLVHKDHSCDRRPERLAEGVVPYGRRARAVTHDDDVGAVAAKRADVILGPAKRYELVSEAHVSGRAFGSRVEKSQDAESVVGHDHHQVAERRQEPAVELDVSDPVLEELAAQEEENRLGFDGVTGRRRRLVAAHHGSPDVEVEAVFIRTSVESGLEADGPAVAGHVQDVVPLYWSCHGNRSPEPERFGRRFREFETVERVDVLAVHDGDGTENLAEFGVHQYGLVRNWGFSEGQQKSDKNGDAKGG